jgi:hypothetical protein
MALREMGNLSLLVALDYLVLLAEVKPEQFPAAAVRWHRRLELETPTPTLAELQLALALLATLGDGHRGASSDVLRALLRGVRPTLVPRLA